MMKRDKHHLRGPGDFNSCSPEVISHSISFSERSFKEDAGTELNFDLQTTEIFSCDFALNLQFTQSFDSAVVLPHFGLFLFSHQLCMIKRRNQETESSSESA